MYAIISNTSEEFDNNNNNPDIKPQNIQRGANHMAEGETEATITAREKVHLTAAEWGTIKAVVNHGVVIPPNSTREVLIGYQYALHQQRKRMLQEKREIQRRCESISAASKILRDERSNASYTNGG
jgi:hypothetical protein